MMPLVYILAAILAAFLLYKGFERRHSKTNGLKDVPDVSFRVPYFGNVIPMYKDPLKFMESCQKVYGEIFRIKLCRANYVVVCNREIAEQLAKANENDFSMYGFQRAISFEQSFFVTETHLAVNVFKKGATFQKSVVTPILQSEAQNLIRVLHDLDLRRPLSQAEQLDYFGKYAARVLYRCFFNAPLEDGLYKLIADFIEWVNWAAKLSHYVPKRLIAFAVRKRITAIRQEILPYVKSAIEKYQADPTLKSETFFRNPCDESDKTGKNFSLEQVLGIFLGTFHAGVSNTKNLIHLVLGDLALDQQLSQALRAEVAVLIENNDMDGILKSPLLNACVLESARLYASIFSLRRYCTNDIALAGYNLKQGDFCCISSPILMQDGIAFKNADKYDPRRFLGENPESFSSNKLTAWGFGTHSCPGKNFAIQEVKLAVAHLMHNFSLEILNKDAKVNYVTSGAFAERVRNVRYTPAQMGRSCKSCPGQFNS